MIPPAQPVSASGPPPSGGIRYSWAEPPRSDRNQSDAESGAQASASSTAVPSVSRRGGELPSAAASHRAASARPAGRPTGLTA